MKKGIDVPLFALVQEYSRKGGLTLEETSQAVCMSYSSFQRKLKDPSTIRIGELTAICRLLRIPREKVLGIL